MQAAVSSQRSTAERTNENLKLMCENSSHCPGLLGLRSLMNK
uniref:Uncharacterized protein n=1 Tax=Arundo donax TaxID=35708 RepID=A0A0A8Z9E3_ARUDO